MVVSPSLKLVMTPAADMLSAAAAATFGFKLSVTSNFLLDPRLDKADMVVSLSLKLVMPAVADLLFATAAAIFGFKLSVTSNFLLDKGVSKVFSSTKVDDVLRLPNNDEVSVS